jgi:hypothetical protein
MFGYLTYMMPYIYVSQVDTPCTLLVEIAGELQDVAKGKILRPTQKLMHNMPMPADVLRVEVLAPLPGFENFVPPYQPHGAEELFALEACPHWPIQWLKKHIRLGSSSAQTTPVPSMARSGKNTPAVPSLLGRSRP